MPSNKRSLGVPRIIDSVLVYDDGPDKSTELNQRVPVAAVTSQPRRFDCEHGTDAAFADRCQQALEARPIDAAAGAAQIIVERLRRQHDIAVLTAFGLLDPNDLLRAVDMLDLEPDHLAGAQAAAVAETEQGADLEVAGDGQQAPRLVRAHH